MPNYCYIDLYVSHESAAEMKKFADAVDKSSLFMSFIPLDGRYDQDLAIREWGTKWDIVDGYFDFTACDGGRSGTARFSTAWNPPIPAFEKLKALGFKIDAYYREPNSRFYGSWDNGEHHHFEH